MKKIKVFAVLMLLVLSLGMSLNAFAAENTREDVTGVLPNGLSYTIHYLTEDEIEARDNAITPYSYSWSGNITVPIKNAQGTNGTQLGNDFIIGPDTKAIISVGNLPSVMPTVNIGATATNGMWSDWIPNVGGNASITLEPASGYLNYSFKVKVSTSEVNSRAAAFSIKTE